MPVARTHTTKFPVADYKTNRSPSTATSVAPLPPPEIFCAGVYNCIHVGTEYKSVRLTEDVYEMLERRKRPEESFSETVERLARERPISDLAGLFSDEDVESIRAGRTNSYQAYAARRKQESDE